MRWKIACLVVLLVAAGAVALSFWDRNSKTPEQFPRLDLAEVGVDHPAGSVETATFGSGCFWCGEAVFQRLEGVRSAVPGYSGGSVPNPSYEQICTGATGHAEVVQVTFEPAKISYVELLEAFWRTHDPTTPNQQGNDFGSQYRSIIFTHNDDQRRLAEQYKNKIDEAHIFPGPVVTEIVPYTAFYPAEDYHRNYYARHSGQFYCRSTIRPKIEKLEKIFAKKLKPAS
jgi:peptide-methionine (S)-S-oxide reductase